jgi:pyruvate carboxylase subunit B
MNKLTFDINGREVSAVVAFGRDSQGRGALWVHMDGETFIVDEPKKESRRGGGTRGGSKDVHPGEIVSPMPGKIIKLLVAKGDRVQDHQVVLVMEAMKMEYTLKAHGAGIVTEIQVEPGEQVALGQVLVKLDPEKKG